MSSKLIPSLGFKKVDRVDLVVIMPLQPIPDSNNSSRESSAWTTVAVALDQYVFADWMLEEYYLVVPFFYASVVRKVDARSASPFFGPCNMDSWQSYLFLYAPLPSIFSSTVTISRISATHRINITHSG